MMLLGMAMAAIFFVRVFRRLAEETVITNTQELKQIGLARSNKGCVGFPG